MRRTKQYKNRKDRKTRRNRTKKNNKKNIRKSRKMKGGGIPFGTELSNAFDTLKFGVTSAIDTGMAIPGKVAPDIKGGDNPLPFKQLGAADDINSYNISQTTQSSQSSPSII
jgi:hypothetical protein